MNKSSLDELYRSPGEMLHSALSDSCVDIHSGYTLPTIKPMSDYRDADYQYEKLVEEIRNFESRLDDDHEISLKLASFGESITIAVTDIGYYNPSLIVFDGIVNGAPATLIQHISQLSFLMVAVKKADPARPPRRIGFDVNSNE